MSLATVGYYAPVTAGVVSGGRLVPPVAIPAADPAAETQSPEILVEVPGFEFFFGTTLRDMHLTDDYSVVTVEALLDPGLAMLVTLKTQVVDEEGNLQIKEVSINFEVFEHRPRAHFLAASLYAMLTLAGPIRVVMPGMLVDVTANFSAPLREVSRLLQRRQAYYALMVVERATGLSLDVPENISGEEMNDISFTYHAIVDRSFDWLAKFVTLPVPANEDALRWLRNLQPRESGGSVYQLPLGPTPEIRIILGQTVPLGPGMVVIPDAVFLNLGDALRELSNLDGRIVNVLVRPLSGMGTYHFPQAPRLPESPWDEKVDTCVKFEDRFNERLSAGYNELATATLADLTPAEVEVVTERPSLGEDAHLIGD